MLYALSRVMQLRFSETSYRASVGHTGAQACLVSCAGSLRSCNPDRIVLKKVVLSGYPVKVQKKKAVVRWMFHSPEDIRWFRPVDLWTKHGRRGQITVRSQPRRIIVCSCTASAS